MKLNMSLGSRASGAGRAGTVPGPQKGLGRPLVFVVIGALLIISMTVMLFTGSSRERQGLKAKEQGERVVQQLGEAVLAFQRLLDDDQVAELANAVLDDASAQPDLERYVRGRMREVFEVRLYAPEAYVSDIDPTGESAFILMSMLLDAQERGAAPVQSLKLDGRTALAGAVPVARGEERRGTLVVLADMELLLSRFNVSLPHAGYIGLQQAAGRFGGVTLSETGDPGLAGGMPKRLAVPGSLFQVVVPPGRSVSTFTGTQRILVFVLGGLFLAVGLIQHQLGRRTVKALREDPAAQAPKVEASEPPAPALERVEPAAPKVSLEDFRFDPERRRRESRPRSGQGAELKEEIFRAYDIRGIVGETLDAGIARRVGQAVGTLALAAGAAPVVVGRDGRHSGPELMAGMVEGIAAAGCDVIDIGAVPTGVLYFMANQCKSGSGVMITGSHNPPDYNGFKIMVGGETLAGDAIKGLFHRIESGDLSEGEGDIGRERLALRLYRDRIASDIQLARPLKVVADCGNGIGGVCAGEILRAIGAEVLPLYDEVDGSFPNHHPDPSEPENLHDLIESVDLMRADLGVAFDGDADRLGVVTPGGDIIFPDRLMMLFVREILGRNPGAKIIYDVKCTNHLEEEIRQAGGVPEMYKTGHSLIKNRMKEEEAPFAGEMSGHFFFGDRWYGFDCGIYSAARLLEILAADERSPREVLASLPDSISTPELKVHMSEGENHAFIEKFQHQANFPDARVSTIDGVRADFEDGWGLCRASNTTPILVVRFDAETEEALAIIQEAFRMQMLAIEPDLDLPF